MPGSCSKGFRSLPSSAAGTRRKNGLDKNSTNSRNPTLTQPSTASTRATKSAGNARLRQATATLQQASSTCHSSMEPSCPPQKAVSL